MRQTMVAVVVVDAGSVAAAAAVDDVVAAVDVEATEVAVNDLQWQQHYVALAIPMRPHVMATADKPVEPAAWSSRNQVA